MINIAYLMCLTKIQLRGKNLGLDSRFGRRVAENYMLVGLIVN